jgi:hypothetical protein
LIETASNVCIHAFYNPPCLTESFSQLLYLYFIHISPSNIAPLFGFSGALLTLCKTTLWVLQEYFCGWCSYSAGLTDFAEMSKHWIVPNMSVKSHGSDCFVPVLTSGSLWFTMCSLIVARLGGDIALSLNQGPKSECEDKE